MRQKPSYPAVFIADLEDPNSINVTFPDIFGGVTCGQGFEDAVRMAEDLLATMLDCAPAQCYEPSSVEKVRKLFPEAEEVLLISPRYHKPS